MTEHSKDGGRSEGPKSPPGIVHMQTYAAGQVTGNPTTIHHTNMSIKFIK